MGSLQNKKILNQAIQVLLIPHLHFTIREGVYKGKHVDPQKYINY